MKPAQTPPVTQSEPSARRVLAQLHRDGHLSANDHQKLSNSAPRDLLALGDRLNYDFAIPKLTFAKAIATLLRAEFIDPTKLAPDPFAIDDLGAQQCLKLGLLPWRRIGGKMVILSPTKTRFVEHLDALTNCFGSVSLAICTTELISAALENATSYALTHEAENAVAPELSSRNWNARVALAVWLASVTGFIGLALYFGIVTLIFVCVATVALLVANSLLKLAAAVASARRTDSGSQALPLAQLPEITILVPLFKETEIAQHLLRRLQLLEYPKALLDVCLITEADDATTRTALGHTTLPIWMRAIVVPAGTLRTKPRALNYAMNFARGSIIGVYDAEDAPDPGQLHQVAARFAQAGPEVACLQGVLDYYNAGSNWLTRCFTVEYATWFGVVLPGLQRMGLVVPLGGTTLFFRRDVLDRLGGWDAHNVTEDADLGVRLARFGYRTEMIQSVTQEEANGRFWPWIKQRSRWLKGYAITYAVHMRNPLRLWRDLGPKRFIGVQLLFAGTLAQFLLAPVLWSFWIVPFGLPHPFVEVMSAGHFWTLIYTFFAAEVISLAIAAVALRRAGKMWLLKWALTLQFYFPLASIGAYKGVLELAWKPFYWDKTAHGILLPDTDQH